MNIKQLGIMAAVAVVLGGAALFLNQPNAPTEGGIAGRKIIELPLNDIAQVTITTAGGALNLVKKDEVWKVQERAEYPADYTRVHDLLRKVWDLKTVQEVKAGLSQYPRLELTDPVTGAAAKVDFKDQSGRTVGALILGKKHMKTGETGMGGDQEFPGGRYVLPVGTQRVSLVSETFQDVEAKPESWLDRDFLKIDEVSAVTLAGASEEQKWKLVRENPTAEWKLEGAQPEEKLDTAKVSSIGTAFSSPSFVDVLAPDSKPADTGLDKPVVVTLETFDGFTYVLKVGKENAGNLPVTFEVSGKFAKERTPGKDEKPEDKKKLDDEFATKVKGFEEKLVREKKFEGRPYLIAKSTTEQVIKDRKSLLQEPPAPPTAPATTPAVPAPPAPESAPKAEN